MSDSEFCRAPCAPVGTSAQRACADARQERLRLAQRTSWSSAACYRAWAACTGSALLAPCLLLEGLLARQQARNRVWHASLCQRGRKRAPGSRQCGQVPRCSRGPSRWPGAQRSLSVRVFPPPPSACTYICNHCRTPGQRSGAHGAALKRARRTTPHAALAHTQDALRRGTPLFRRPGSLRKARPRSPPQLAPPWRRAPLRRACSGPRSPGRGAPAVAVLRGAAGPAQSDALLKQ